MSFKINKILIFILTGLLTMSEVAYAANKNNNNNNVQPALRLADDREEVIDRITNERIHRQIKPLDESEAAIIKEKMLENEKIKKQSLYNPKKLYRTLEIDTSDLTKEHHIFLAPNYITTLIFLDKSGNIWPIKTYTPGLGKLIKHNPIENGTIILQPLTEYARGNIVLSLVDSKIPITMTLEVGTEKVDYKTEIRVNDYGPNSQPEIFDSGVKGAQDLSSMAKFLKEDMFNILEGVTPEGYKKRKTDKFDVEAWTKDKHLFIRTKDMLISPNLLPIEYNKIKSADGTYVYAVPYMPYVMLSRHGNIIKVKIK